MKRILEAQLRETLSELLPGADIDPGTIRLERTRDPRHGDFATNVAMLLGKRLREPPRALAERIVAALPRSDTLESVEVAGPGFINFKLTPAALASVVADVLELGAEYGRSDAGAGRSLHLEFVSANPTGPLHIGHGRGAAYGAAVAALLAAAGYQVYAEYYVNDAGRQMDILALSIALRYLELEGFGVPFPAKAYQGAYVTEIAEAARRAGLGLVRPPTLTWPADSGQPERYVDDCIGLLKSAWTRGFEVLLEFGLQRILEEIRRDLEAFGVRYDNWFSERSLASSMPELLDRLQETGACYRKEGALWFRSSDYGDEKDRVLVRDNGEATYFAADVAYHVDKLERGFDRMINVWGADHHGYVARVRAALAVLGYDAERLDVRLVQFASLYRGSEKVQMSTRSGEFVTLRALCDEVGRDAARYFYVVRKSEQHLDFDLELAKSRSNENPVYYIQYAHARVCSVFKQLEQQGLDWDRALGEVSLNELNSKYERELQRQLSRFPEVIETAAENREPHQLAYYLQELATIFSAYYDAQKFIVESAPMRNARLNLIAACRQVLANGLGLLGVSAPRSM